MNLVLGTDELGRGPVIGSLFIAAVVIEENKINKLKKIGVKDSKLLTHKKRIELARKIKRIVKKYEVVKVGPREIDKAVDGHDGLNLNRLEARKTALLINKLKPDKAIIDCPSPNIKVYTLYLKRYLKNKKVELVVEHKADFKFPIVAAASILAKCGREEEVDKLKKKYGNIGPGYPSNEITQKFLKENYEKHPEIFRHSWAPSKNHRKAKEQLKLDKF